MSKKCRNAPQILSSHEVKEYARAVAIMVYRYRPEVYHRTISAHEIAETLGNLPGGQLSTFHVDNDTLKKAFANKFIREVLKDKFPLRYDFSRSSTVLDVIRLHNIDKTLLTGNESNGVLVIDTRTYSGKVDIQRIHV